MRGPDSFVNYYRQRKQDVEKIYATLPEQDRSKVNAAVDQRMGKLNEMFQEEIRPGNGFDKALRRERNRITIEETVQLSQTIKSNPLPFQENSDGEHPGMVFIPTGPTKIGTDQGFLSREEPEREIGVSGFWIDACAVTNSDYHDLYPMHKPDPHAANDDMPVVNVTWFDAAKYCAALGKRLPTQAEWEKAARGPDNWLYSFGREFNRKKVHIWPAGGVVRVRHHEPNPWGLYEMSGNVWEWTEDIFCKEVGLKQRIFFNLARGGSWRHCPWGARATISLCLDLAHRSENVGFRCACDY